MKDLEELVEFVGGKLINKDKYGFSRTIKFTINNIDYFIQWWKNIGYLSIGRSRAQVIPFDNCFINTTWPTHMGGLRFEYLGNISVVLELDQTKED